MNESKVVMCYPVICEQADDGDVVGDGWLSLHLFYSFMGNFMEVNTAFDGAGRAIVVQNGNGQRAALSWASSEIYYFCINIIISYQLVMKICVLILYFIIL